MQPLNAARLFSAALSHQQSALPKEARELVQHWTARCVRPRTSSPTCWTSRAWKAAGSPGSQPLPLATLFDTLGTEFTALAREQGVNFRVHGSKLRVDSDIRLLRRVLQNFLTNAFRYAKGRVVLGVRRQGSSLREVWDRGRAFRRTSSRSSSKSSSARTATRPAPKGLGLGTAIADGLCHVLDHPLEVRSRPGKGSVFSVTVPIARAVSQPRPAVKRGEPQHNALTGTQVLCIDNEDSILVGMNSLLTRWGCGLDRQQPRRLRSAAGGRHPSAAGIGGLSLDEGQTGTELMAGCVPASVNRCRCGDQRRRAPRAGGGHSRQRHGLPRQAGEACGVASVDEPPSDVEVMASGLIGRQALLAG